jgi:Protein of unknown function (DUF3237)
VIFGLVSRFGMRVTCAASCGAILLSTALTQSAIAQTSGAIGTEPDPELFPRAEFVFEERVTIAPAVEVGDTPIGHRQYIPITGGQVSGPKLRGRVIPGGWDYQRGLGDGCTSLTADYFLEADDGTVIHILNEALTCPDAGDQTRLLTRPRFEAPEGPHAWLTRGTFVGVLEPEVTATTPNAASSDGSPPPLGAIRIRVYQIQ